MKTVLFLTDDYWHHADTIKPLADILFPPAEWNLVFTKNPQEMFAVPDLDLLVSFKDPVENDQIPTPVWCDQKWTDTLLEKIQSGLGFIPVHAAVTDMEESHPICCIIKVPKVAGPKWRTLHLQFGECCSGIA